MGWSGRYGLLHLRLADRIAAVPPLSAVTLLPSYPPGHRSCLFVALIVSVPATIPVENPDPDRFIPRSWLHHDPPRLSPAADLPSRRWCWARHRAELPPEPCHIRRDLIIFLCRPLSLGWSCAS